MLKLENEKVVIFKLVNEKLEILNL